MAHILKISDEELEFITGKADIKEALPRLFAGNTRLVIYTKGAEGAECYTESTSAYADGQKVKAVDTTGAGAGGDPGGGSCGCYGDVGNPRNMCGFHWFFPPSILPVWTVCRSLSGTDGGEAALRQ